MNSRQIIGVFRNLFANTAAKVVLIKQDGSEVNRLKLRIAGFLCKISCIVDARLGLLGHVIRVAHAGQVFELRKRESLNCII